MIPDNSGDTLLFHVISGTEQLPAVSKKKKNERSEKDNGIRIEKLSTTLYHDQIEIISNLSRRTGLPSAGIYRYAIDYFIVAIKKNLKAFNIKIPGRLEKVSEAKMKEHTLRPLKIKKS